MAAESCVSLGLCFNWAHVFVLFSAAHLRLDRTRKEKKRARCDEAVLFTPVISAGSLIVGVTDGQNKTGDPVELMWQLLARSGILK